MRIRLLLAVAVIGADGLTKAALPTPRWGWDPRPFSASAAVLAAVACLLLLSFTPTRTGAALMLAGCTANMLSTLHGPVANPFVVGDLAFNLADVSLAVGFLCLVCSTPAVYRFCRQHMRPTEATP